MTQGTADRIFDSVTGVLADYQGMLVTAARLDDDPQASRRAMEAAQVVMDARQRLLALSMPQAPQGPPAAQQQPATPTRKIDDYSKPPLSYEEVYRLIPAGRWVSTAEVESLVDWSQYSTSRGGRHDDILRRLIYLDRRGLVERDPPMKAGRKGHNIRWRRLA